MAVFHFIQVPDSHFPVFYWEQNLRLMNTLGKSNRQIYGIEIYLWGMKHFERMRNDLVNNLHLIDCCATSNKIYCRAWLMFRFNA